MLPKVEVFDQLRDPSAHTTDWGTIQVTRADAVFLRQLLADELDRAEAQYRRWRTAFKEHERTEAEDSMEEGC